MGITFLSRIKPVAKSSLRIALRLCPAFSFAISAQIGRCLLFSTH